MDPTGLYVVRHHRDSEGPPVLLVHGGPDRSTSFSQVVSQLPRTRVTVYDRRGYGQSIAAGDHPVSNELDDHPVSKGFEAHVADLLVLLADEPAVVCGQSMGATIALIAAHQHPELFLSLGLWEPPMVAWDWSLGPEALAVTRRWAEFEDPRQLGETFARSMLGESRWEQLSAATKDLLRAEGAALRADLISQLTPQFEVGPLSVPTVVACGSASLPGFGEANRRLAERLDVELMIVADAGHFAHRTHPHRWVEMVHQALALTPLQAESLQAQSLQLEST